MISVQRAQQLIEAHCPPPQEENIFVSAARGRVNAHDLKSPLHLPLFDNSAMDGFALKSRDTMDATFENPVLLNVKGMIKAGDAGQQIVLRDQEACRIMTGAPIPRSADAVIAKERAVLKDGSLAVSSPVLKGTNIRHRGEELKKGQKVIPKGTLISPGTIGFLATLGIERISVYRAPKITLITTGSELVAAGRPLAAGKIYDSNTPMIRAALEEMGIRPVFIRKLVDEPRIIKKILAFALKESDLIILMGGVSVGDCDYVKDALRRAGVSPIFWKVSQKPGKPLYFGKKNKTLVFGLPGNPAAVFTCFYEYVYPAIRIGMGHKGPYLRSGVMKLCKPVQADPEKTLFLKGKTDENNGVVPLKRQQSHMISSFCEADSLVVIPPSSYGIRAGEEALVHSLPHFMDG